MRREIARYWNPQGAMLLAFCILGFFLTLAEEPVMLPIPTLGIIGVSWLLYRNEQRWRDTGAE